MAEPKQKHQPGDIVKITFRIDHETREAINAKASGIHAQTGIRPEHKLPYDLSANDMIAYLTRWFLSLSNDEQGRIMNEGRRLHINFRPGKAAKVDA